MFLLVSVRHVGAHPGGHQHGVSIQISINLGRTFLQISRVRNIPLTWNLARVFAYLPPFICQILGLIFWTVLIFILIYCEWHDTENQQYYKRNLSKKKRIEKNRPLKVRKYYKIGKLPKFKIKNKAYGVSSKAGKHLPDMTRYRANKLMIDFPKKLQLWWTFVPPRVCYGVYVANEKAESFLQQTPVTFVSVSCYTHKQSQLSTKISWRLTPNCYLGFAFTCYI